MTQTMRVLITALLCLLVPCASIPSFVVDLDAPAKDRWASVVTHYRQELIAMSKALDPLLEQHLGASRASWLEVAKFDDEFEAELQGIADVANDTSVTTDLLRLTNLIYELASPTACSGVLWAMPNGTVLHGRNMDYAFHFQMPDGRVLNWPDVTHEVTFFRGGQPLFRSTQWPGGLGIHTAMRFNGWSFEQNTRSGKNEWPGNLAAAQKGGMAYTLAARRVMESVSNFEEAVQTLYATKFMAPMYFIMSGTGVGEGAVLSIDRLGVHDPSTPPIQRLHPETAGWHLVQTNDDLLSYPFDERRPMANTKLALALQKDVAPERLMDFMQSPPLYVHGGTVFTTLMVPATGLYVTLITGKDASDVAPEPFSLSAVSGVRSLRGKRRPRGAIAAPGQI